MSDCSLRAALCFDHEPCGERIGAWRGTRDSRMASPTIYKGQRGLAFSHETGAKQRPRQSRRPSAAKRIIRAEVPKDTGPMIPTPTSLRQSPCSTRR